MHFKTLGQMPWVITLHGKIDYVASPVSRTSGSKNQSKSPIAIKAPDPGKSYEHIFFFPHTTFIGLMERPLFACTAFRVGRSSMALGLHRLPEIAKPAAPSIAWRWTHAKQFQAPFALRGGIHPTALRGDELCG